MHHNQTWLPWDLETMDKAKEMYSPVTIVQESDLKKKLEEVGVNTYGMKIAYPFIKIATINKAVNLFSKGLTSSAKKTNQLFLELICFGIISTIISFDVKYYEYNRG